MEKTRKRLSLNSAGKDFKRTGSLKRSMMLSIMVTVLVPLIAVGVVTGFLMTSAVERMEISLDTTRSEMAENVVGQRLKADAANTMFEIDSFMRERILDVLTWSETPLVRKEAVRAGNFAELLGLPSESESAVETRMAEKRAIFPESEATHYLVHLTKMMPEFTESLFHRKARIQRGL
jgi:hypothetical protein